jgi:hypothetical protein
MLDIAYILHKRWRVYFEKILGILFSLVLMLGFSLPSYASASMLNIEDCQQCNKEPLSKEDIRKDGGIVKDVKINDENYQLGIEIAQSNLEETTIIDEKGFVKSAYINAEQAGVSEKKAYQAYLQTLDFFMLKLKKKGTIKMDKGLTIVSYEPAKMEFEKNVNRVKVFGTTHFYLSNSDLSKVIKVIAFGGSASALAAALGVAVGVAAPILAGAAFLGAGLNLCNWNDKGIILAHINNMWSCTPAK